MAYDLEAAIEAQVIDKLLVVMKTKDQELEAKIAKLGTNVGSASTWADRPTVDLNGAAVQPGDVFTLTTADGTHPAGKYERKADNSDWEDQPFINFDALNINQIIADAKADPSSVTIDPNTGAVTNDLTDNKFTTPTQVGEDLEAFRQALLNVYHPKGGSETLTIVAADATEGTKEVVNASQLQITFTQAEINAKYDAL